MNQNNRLKYIDAAKGWGILMVAFGHITDLANPVDNYFSSYKLALFFIISGYLISMHDTFFKYDLKSYLKKQIDSLLLPYFAYSFITIIYDIFYKYIVHGKTISQIQPLLFQLNYSTFTLRGISALWFIPSLFIGQILLYIVLSKEHKWTNFLSIIIPLVISEVFLIILPIFETNLSDYNYMIVSYPILTISRSIVAFFFLFIGYRSYSFIKALTEKKEMILGITLTLANIYLSQFNKSVNLFKMDLGYNSMMFFITGIIGSFGILLLFKYLDKHISFNFFSYCGNKSLIILATHNTLCFKEWSIKIYDNLIGISKTVCFKYYIDNIIILFILLTFEFGVIKIIEYFPLLCGKKKILSYSQ